MNAPVQPHSTPSEVNAEQGQVLVEGPDGVAVSLTADAADETAERLVRAARDARRQAEAPRQQEQGKG